MTKYIAFTAATLLCGVLATPVFAQTTPSNTTIQGTESAPGNASGGPSAATTAGNLSTTTFTRNGAVIASDATSIAPPANMSSNGVAQTPGSPANTGK